MPNRGIAVSLPTMSAIHKGDLPIVALSSTSTAFFYPMILAISQPAGLINFIPSGPKLIRQAAPFPLFIS